MTLDRAGRQERRRVPRLLCADMIFVELETRPKRWRRVQANLEDISSSGACVEVDEPVPAGASARLVCRDFRVSATVRHCTFRETGYLVGLEFREGQKWSRGQFWPKHLTDPQTVRAKPAPPNVPKPTD